MLICTAENEKGIFDAILEGQLDFESQPWPSISDSAKDLVRKMLTPDPKKRITSTQVLGITSLLCSILGQVTIFTVMLLLVNLFILARISLDIRSLILLIYLYGC